MCKKSSTFAAEMDKKNLLHIIEWTVAAFALVYLAYRLLTYDDYASLAASLRGMDSRQWAALGICIALMPMNMWLEAWKWKTLMDDLTMREAVRQVYQSKLAGLITPWRLGEYPARGLMMKGKHIMRRTLSMGAIGSATMTIAIVSAGMIALVFSPSVLALLGNSYLYAVAAVLLLLAVALYGAPRWLHRYAELNSAKLWISLAQSYARLACWSVQLALVLYALSSISNLQSPISNIPIYYLLVTVTPNVPIVEVGVRGAWAMFIFGTANAALAGVLLWAINTFLPCLVALITKCTPCGKQDVHGEK